MADKLKRLEEAAEVVETPSGATLVAVEEEILAAHILAAHDAAQQAQATEIADDDPILEALFGNGDDGDDDTEGLFED